MIVVTGATGFVGQALLQDLAHRHIPYRAVSRSDREGFVAIGDMTPSTDWSDALAGAETVVHLAARVHIMKDKAADPLLAFRTVNVDATCNLARQAHAHGVKRFVFLSSIKVNGEVTGIGRPFTSEDKPAPCDAYAVSKWEAEIALRKISQETGLDIVVIRPPLVYGPGVRANFAALLRWVGRGVPLPFGAVSNRRSLIFVKNLTDLIIVCAQHAAARNRTFLASDGEDLALPQLLKAVSEAKGKGLLNISVPPHLLRLLANMLGKNAAADRLLGSLQVDIENTKTTLDWSPPFSCLEGLKQTVEATPADTP